MTGPDTGPLLPRRRLGAAFRDLREARGETLQQTAAAVLFSPSKLSRIENGIAGEPHPRDVRDLLAHFTVDGPERAELEALAEAARRPGWWQVPPYDMPGRLDTHISYESTASRIEVYSPTAVPGILQTPQYARAILARLLPHLTPAEVDLQAEVRLERRRRMQQRAEPPHQTFIIPEAVLHRTVGSAAVMDEQLTFLQEEPPHPNVEFHVIPFTAGIYEAVELTTVTIFTFSSDLDADIVEIERLRHTEFYDKRQTLRKYREIFDSLPDYWLDHSESSTFVENVRRQKWQESQ